jgi:hypothetical protein
VLAVWLLSTRRAVPVATRRDEAGVSWLRPWAEARRHPDPTLPDLTAALTPPLAALLPPGLDASAPPAAAPGSPQKRWVLQTFEDQKMNRQGWGDVVLVPEAPVAFDEARVARLDRLMSALDPWYRAPTQPAEAP